MCFNRFLGTLGQVEKFICMWDMKIYMYVLHIFAVLCTTLPDLPCLIVPGSTSTSGVQAIRCWGRALGHGAMFCRHSPGAFRLQLQILSLASCCIPNSCTPRLWRVGAHSRRTGMQANWRASRTGMQANWRVSCTGGEGMQASWRASPHGMQAKRPYHLWIHINRRLLNIVGY
jgi:hypothetical protein